MPYSQYTLGQLQSEISQALADASNVYWSVDEIERAINEALLYWGALSNYWRDRGQFQTTANEPRYDLSVKLQALRTRTYTLGQLTKEIQYHLLEPANGTAGTGMTAQFTVARLTSALSRYRNQFVIDTRIPLTFGAFAVTPPPDGRVELDPSVIAVSHAAWLDGTSAVYFPLRREDPWAAQSYAPQFNLNPGTPYAYSLAETRPIEMQLIPPPLASGQLQLTYAKSLTLAVADTTSLALPDEFALAVKWGALYEVLSNYSEGFDPMRAQYCLERYTQCVTAATSGYSIIRVLVNNAPVQTDTVFNLDAVSPRWLNQSGTPTLGAAFYDLLYLSPVPNTALIGVTCDVVRSAPLPVVSTDFLQVGPEEIPYIFDYARHILSFKMGGTEFAATMPLYDNFISGAAQRNKLLSTKARYLTPLFGQPAKEESLVPAA